MNAIYAQYTMKSRLSYSILIQTCLPSAYLVLHEKSALFSVWALDIFYIVLTLNLKS